MSLPFLQSFGLTQNEADLYELLLRLGEAPIATILKEAGMKRPTVYKSLYSLEKKGLVNQQDVHKKLHFRPEPPDKLLQLAQQQYSELDRAKKDLQATLPQLTSSYVLSVEKPIIRMYEGIEGIMKANLEVLAEKKEILAYVYVDEEIDKSMDAFWKKYYHIRMRDNIFVRSISPQDKAGIEYQKNDASQLRKTMLVPTSLFPINIEKNIVGNKVVFFSRQEGKLIATIIENKLIADTERAIFELAWKEAERYNQSIEKVSVQ